MLWANSVDDKFIIFLCCSQKIGFYISCKLFPVRRYFAQNVKSYFLGKVREIFQKAVCWNFYTACLASNTWDFDAVMLKNSSILHAWSIYLVFKGIIFTVLWFLHSYMVNSTNSDLGLYCLPKSTLWDIRHRHKWMNVHCLFQVLMKTKTKNAL